MSKIKIVAIGYRGMLILEELLKIISIDADSILIETLDLNFEHSSAKIKIDVGKSERLGLDGGSAQRSARLAEKCSHEIFSALDGAEFVLSIIDLGCDDGEGIPPVIADIAKKIGAQTIFAAYMPFNMMPFRERNAHECLAKLETGADAVMQIDALYLAKRVPSKTLFYDGYMMVMTFAAQDVKNILDCYVSKARELST